MQNLIGIFWWRLSDRHCALQSLYRISKLDHRLGWLFVHLSAGSFRTGSALSIDLFHDVALTDAGGSVLPGYFLARLLNCLSDRSEPIHYFLKRERCSFLLSHTWVAGKQLSSVFLDHFFEGRNALSRSQQLLILRRRTRDGRLLDLQLICL